MGQKKISVRYYFSAFLLTVILALALLLFSAFLPQSVILSNINSSVGGLNTEGYRPYTFDLQDAGALDTYTDTEMLRATATMHSGNLKAILTNDYYVYNDAASVMEQLEFCTLGREADSIMYYVRYWMGFRALLRFGLIFLNYFQIRRYLGLAFFCVFLALIFRIAKHTDQKLAYLFALSVFLVRPNVIVSSLQYSCCFFIVFAAMMLIPWLYRNPKWDKLFFMEIGMITMYFDFYTVPLITFGYPVVYLFAMQIWNREKVSVKKMLTLLCFWFVGWGFMWIAKLTLTTLLTDVNGFVNGFGSFFGRIGIVKNQDLLQYYSVPYAFAELFRVVFSDRKGAIVYIVGVMAILVTIVCQAVRKKISFCDFLEHKIFLIIALLPFAWFAITAQPIAIHAFFQYRSIAITYWSIGAYLFAVFQGRNEGCQQVKTGFKCL